MASKRKSLRRKSKTARKSRRQRRGGQMNCTNNGSNHVCPRQDRMGNTTYNTFPHNWDNNGYCSACDAQKNY